MNTPKVLSAPPATIRDVREMSPAEVAQGLPITVSGVIVYHEPQGWRTFICDGEDGIYVHLKLKDITAGTLDVGMMVEVEGVVSAGDFNTCIEGPSRSSA